MASILDLLKLWKLYRVIKDALAKKGDPMKTGWQTSEFWVTILTVVLPILEKVFKLEGDTLTSLLPNLAAILAAVAYIFGRSKVKAATIASTAAPTKLP